jgi:CRP/FNR family transcriptional regulator
MHTIISKYCSEEWQDFVKFHSQQLSYKAGENIFNIGDPTEGLYFISSGKIKILTTGVNDTERIIRLATDGDILGHRGFGGTWEYSITATTLTPTDVVFIPIEIFNQTVKANAQFGFYMMMFFAEELRDSERLAKLLPVKNLVASALYTNYKIFGLEKGSTTKLSFTLSRKDIANKSGTTYESVVRSLAELNKDGIIKIDGKAIHILDVERLKQMSTHAT